MPVNLQFLQWLASSRLEFIMKMVYLVNVSLLMMILFACQPTATDTAVPPEPIDTTTPTMTATRPTPHQPQYQPVHPAPRRPPQLHQNHRLYQKTPSG